MHTRLIHKWIHLFVRNLNNTVPSLGNMCGYLLVFCASRSGTDRGGPGYCLGGRRFRRWGCEGGRNLSGFSSTMGLPCGISVEACRTREKRIWPIGESVRWRVVGMVSWATSWSPEGRRMERRRRRDITEDIDGHITGASQFWHAWEDVDGAEF